MSASTPNTGDLEALRRAQRAYEPSMEEILASIRSIIAEDREPDRAATAPPPRIGASGQGPQIVYSSDAPTPLRAVEVAARTEPTASVEPMTPKVVWRQPEPEEAPVEIEPANTPEPQAEMASDAGAETSEDTSAQAPPPAPEPEPDRDPAPAVAPLLSDDAGRAVSSSFQTLSTSLALQSAELAERLAREMVRPMLKTWLDENLPALVERLVRAEIQRVARGGR